MHSKNLPERILFKPDVLWNVSGLFAKDKILLDFLRILEERFGQKNVFASVHGSPPLIWNSGRSTVPLNKKQINDTIELYLAKDIPLYLTFSNPFVKAKDLDNSACNYLLDKIAKESRDSGVILTSKVLHSYIKDKYPHLKIVSSALRCVFHKGVCDLAFYEELAEIFDRVVVHPDDSINFPLLKELSDKDKFEILINENCQYKCDGRQIEHSIIALNCYQGHHNLSLDDIQNENSKLRCNSAPMKKQVNFRMNGSNPKRFRNLNFSYRDLNLLYDLGFRNFKLQGRLDGITSFLQDLTRYVLEPDFIYPMMFKYLTGFCNNNTYYFPIRQDQSYLSKRLALRGTEYMKYEKPAKERRKSLQSKEVSEDKA